MPQLEAWEKVLVGEGFLGSVHGKQDCVSCHGGVSSTTIKDEAHEGMTRDPVAENACGSCHAEVVERAESSLHGDVTGFKTVLQDRGADLENPQVIQAFNNHCSTCHTTCGQCHVSRPDAAGGGLLAGHAFKKVAPQGDTCLGCHGARIGADYMGELEGATADVHYARVGMPCVGCHSEVEFHGDGESDLTRYSGAPEPSCIGCHPDSAPDKSSVMQHTVHGDRLACQVCHSSGDYKSCSNCHVGKDEKGLSYRVSDPSTLTFKIGLNTEKSPERPWDYVLVRAVPATEDLFAYYGDNLLPEFDNVPTWKYTTPHNIQRITPQNKDCGSCHGHTELFLSESDLGPTASEADRKVVVSNPPK